MKRICGAAVLLLAFVFPVGAQSPQELLQSYTRNFAIAGIDVKIEIIRDAGASGHPELGPLYHQAVSFVLDNFGFVHTDQRFRQLAGAALQRLRETAYREARFSVWKLFDLDKDTAVRVACLNALAFLAEGDTEIIGYINGWLSSQNTVFRTGKVPDVNVISACVQALGRLADQSSFRVLFATMGLGYTEGISRDARSALLALRGDLEQGLKGVLREGSLEEKREALTLALESERLSEEAKAEIAQFTLDVGLHTALADNPAKQSARELRAAAARALSARGWAPATPLALEHFDTVLFEYDRGLSDLNRMIEAVELLGNMGTHEAAVRLTQYLRLVNSYTEGIQEYDNRIVLAVVRSLGRLGDKTAFDDLMYAQYLSYSGEIKQAVRRALEDLKW